MDVIGERDFEGTEFKISFGDICYLSTPLQILGRVARVDYITISTTG